jgi:Ca-activated chloride channel homolog
VSGLLPLPALVLREPGMLLLAALVPAALLLARRARAAAPLAAAALAEPLPPTWRTRLVRLPRALEAAALLLFVVALARPAEPATLHERREGIDLLLCLDRSSSMRADDLAAGRARLALAKEAAARFVAGRPDDRIGLITFARWPDLACPPTLDHRALLGILATVEPLPDDHPEDATGIGTAVARAAETLAAAGSSRVVVLLTDGAENVARADAPGEIAPAHAAQLCERLGVRVHAIVAGSDAVPAAGGGTSDARPVATLARRTGGTLLAARDAAGLARAWQQIATLETRRQSQPRHVLEDRHRPCIVAGLALLVLGLALGAGPLKVLP